MKARVVTGDSEPGVNCLFVLGMHRSGTSALSGCLHRLGVQLGGHLMPPNPSNETGYWEHQDIVIVHDTLLRDLDCKWDMVGNLPQGWQESEAANRARNSIRAILARDFQADKLWAVKDPRLCQLLPLWEPLWQEQGFRPGFVIMLRHPWEVARSLQKRDGCDLLRGHLLWLTHNRRALAFCRDKPHLLVAYDHLLTDPIPVLRHTAEQFAIAYPYSLEQRYAQILEFVRADLKHHRAGRPEAQESAPAAFAPFAQVYADLCAQAAAQLPSPEAPANTPGKRRSRTKRKPAGQGLWLEQGEPQDSARIFDDMLALIGKFERAAQEFNREKEHRLLSHSEQDGLLYVQAYFPTAQGGYTEDQSAKVLLPKEVWQQIRIAVPDPAVLRRHPLRFDPLSTKGVISISRLQLVNAATGRNYWNAARAADFEACKVHNALRLPSEDGLLLMAYSQDSQILLPALPELPDCPLELRAWLKLSSEQQLAAEILQRQQQQAREREKALRETFQQALAAKETHLAGQLKSQRRDFENKLKTQEEAFAAKTRRLLDLHEERLAAKRQQLLDLQNEIRRQEEALRSLTAFTEKLDAATQTIFASLTWRSGYFVAELMRRIMFRPKEPLIQDHIHNLRSRFFSWKRGHFQRPGLSGEDPDGGDGEKKITVAALITTRGDGEPSGSAYIRLLQPLRHPTVGHAVALTVCRFVEELLALEADIIIIQRSALPDRESAEAVIAHCRGRKIPLIYETDDDLFAAGGKKALRNPYPQKVRKAVKRIIEAADRVVVSSPPLQARLQEFNPRVVCIPNALDETLWLARKDGEFFQPRREPEGDRVRILYMGTRTHGEDLQMVEKAYQKLRQEYGSRVTLEVVGGLPYGMRTFAEVVPVGGIHPEADDYPAFVSWIRQQNRWDFGIIPLALTDFNRRKSYIKFLDYSALGLASVCSDIEPYRAVVEEGRNGLLVANDTESWYRAMKRLIDDPDLRARLAENAFNDLIRHHLLQTRARHYLGLCREMAGPAGGDGRPAFDEEAYLSQNPDVAEAIRSGAFESARHHWEVCGCREVAAGRRIYRPDRLFGQGKRCALTPAARQILREEIEGWARRPLISVIMPVYNVAKEWLEKAVRSVQNQVYPHWELCIADDGSTAEDTLSYLRGLQDARIRIHFLQANRGIAKASNEALAQARGDYVALLDHDDELTEEALYEVAKAINEHRPDLIYSDEDKITLTGEPLEPHFKPDYSPDTILSQNYISHLSVYRKSMVDAIGGFREGFEGSQDYDLLLRFLEKAERVHHIPKILYHWRKVTGSTAETFHSKSYAWEAGKKALQEAVGRRRLNARVELGKYPGTYRVRREIPGRPPVSIIIPFKDKPKLLAQCLDSILTRSTYPHFEIIGVNNRSTEEETFALMEDYRRRDERIRFEDYNYPFNFSAINNYGAARAAGEHLILLNNDIEIISAEWIEALLEHSQRPQIGAVGGKLYFPNDTIQHAGVIVGLGGVAGHSHKHFPRKTAGYFYQPNIIRNMSAVTAACLMVKKRLYEALGGLEEKHLKIAFNDVDFCLRLMERGHVNVYTPYCEAYHHESISRGYEDTPQKQARFAAEIKYMKKRHGEILRRGDPYYNPNLTLDSEDFSIRLAG